MTLEDLAMNAVRDARASGLTLRQLAMLTALRSREKAWGTRELAAHVGVSTSCVTRACQGLEPKGLITNRVRSDNKKLRAIAITDDGLSLLSSIETVNTRRVA